MLKRLLTPFQFGLRSALLDATLVGNSFVWYYAVLILLLQEIVTKINPSFSQSVLIWGLHFGGLIISAVAGTFVSKKIQQRQLIILWMVFGAISSLAVIAINPSSIEQVSIIGLFLGISLGFGMPTCIDRFANSVPVESRGRVSGITIFASGIGIVAFSVSGISGILILGIVLTILRLVGLMIFLSVKVPSTPLAAKKSNQGYKKIIGQRSFILYFVPWVMFSLLNYLIAPSTGTIINTSGAENLSLVQTGFIGIFALLGGFFIDSVGRKRIAVIGFILLGLGTAVLGFFSPNPSLPILFLNAILDGTAWGLLFVLFILTLWGDLGYGESSEKYYALGVMPFFISKFLDLTVSRSFILPYFESQAASYSALFSFGAFFLFIAVLPLIYAPETLPEKALKERDLKSYIEKAKKVALKEEGKKHQNKEKTEQTNEDGKDEKENNEKYDEARKLAEKYY
jgi:MFS family permease